MDSLGLSAATGKSHPWLVFARIGQDHPRFPWVDSDRPRWPRLEMPAAYLPPLRLRLRLEPKPIRIDARDLHSGDVIVVFVNFNTSLTGIWLAAPWPGFVLILS